MRYIARFDYIHPWTMKILVPKNSIFTEQVRKDLDIVFGFDEFTPTQSKNITLHFLALPV